VGSEMCIRDRSSPPEPSAKARPAEKQVLNLKLVQRSHDQLHLKSINTLTYLFIVNFVLMQVINRHSANTGGDTQPLTTDSAVPKRYS